LWNEAQGFERPKRASAYDRGNDFDRIRLYGERWLLNGQETFGDLESYELLFGGEAALARGLGLQVSQN
jgi:hypothetical protein